MIKPKYNKNIIALIIFKGVFNLYISLKEIWILDYNKTSIPDDLLANNVREGIMILDEKTIEMLLPVISNYLITSKELQKLFLDSYLTDQENSIYNYKPSLIINFNYKLLYSIFPEYLSFEEYVPESWESKYKSFYNLIGEEFKHWKNKNINYFGRSFI